MAAPKLSLDGSRSRLTVRTRAKGMLARLAHDLELVATRVAGSAELDGEAWTGEIVVAVDGLEVAGVLEHDRLDPGVLSASDRRDILKRMKDDAFRGAAEVKVRACGSSRDRADLLVSIAGREARSDASLSVRDEGGAVVVVARSRLSLRALGAREIKAPLGAFSVKDEIEIHAELHFSR
jgi:hypothetical protein